VTRDGANDDVAAVHRVLLAYARHLDAGEVDRVMELFTDDCKVNYAKGDTWAMQGRSTVAAHLATTLSRFSATSHHISNVDIVVDGEDTATSQCYLYAWHRFAKYPDKPDFEFWGRYDDELIRTDDGWRIAVRRLTMAGKRNIGGHFEPVVRRVVATTAPASE
jgi:ketosteroid isomerase-like protein